MRTFIAAEISDEIKEKINEFIFKNYKDLGNNKIKWVKKDNVHITVKFIGEIEPEQCNNIKQNLYTVIKEIKKFNVSIETIGVFPKINSARVLWIGIKTGFEKLKQIVDLVNKNLSTLGIKEETRPFQPHLTIGRVRFINNIEKIKLFIEKNQNINFGTCSIDHLTFFESILKPQGPEYKIIEKIFLQ